MFKEMTLFRINREVIGRNSHTYINKEHLKRKKGRKRKGTLGFEVDKQDLLVLRES